MYLYVSIIFFMTGRTRDLKVLWHNYPRGFIYSFRLNASSMTSTVVFDVVSATAKNGGFLETRLLNGFFFSAELQQRSAAA